MCLIEAWHVFLINERCIDAHIWRNTMKEIWKCLYIVFKYDFCIKIYTVNQNFDLKRFQNE